MAPDALVFDLDAKSGMLLNLAEAHGLAGALYVGDTSGDRDAPAEARMDFAFVEYGFGQVGGVRLSFARFDDPVAYYLD